MAVRVVAPRHSPKPPPASTTVETKRADTAVKLETKSSEPGNVTKPPPERKARPDISPEIAEDIAKNTRPKLVYKVQAAPAKAVIKTLDLPVATPVAEHKQPAPAASKKLGADSPLAQHIIKALSAWAKRPAKPGHQPFYMNVAMIDVDVVNEWIAHLEEKGYVVEQLATCLKVSLPVLGESSES
jgi:hypothetical protein